MFAKINLFLYKNQHFYITSVRLFEHLSANGRMYQSIHAKYWLSSILLPYIVIDLVLPPLLTTPTN